MSNRNLRRKALALFLAGLHSLRSSRKLPITKLKPLFDSLPSDFRLIVADVGSIGGLHQRWRVLRPHLITLNFDPLDTESAEPGNRYFPFLLGAGEGRASLKVTKRSSMSSTLVPNQGFFAPFWNKPEDVEIVEQFEAPVATLDSIASKEDLWPDALKIDVQGGEASVLHGAGDALRRSVLVAEIECSFAERYEGQESFDQIMTRMRRAGFALLDLRRLKRYRYRNSSGVVDASLGRGMRAGRLAFCDAIFVREPDTIFRSVESGDHLMGLKAIVLALTYGKADLGAAIFDRCADKLPDTTRDAFAAFFGDLSGEGGTRHQLHLDFDAWSQRV